MKDDLIKRQDAINAVKHAWAKGLEPTQYIEALPSAEPERKNGKWAKYKTLSRGYGQIYYQHDCCSNLYESPYPFCPNCGAEMRGE